MRLRLGAAVAGAGLLPAGGAGDADTALELAIDSRPDVCLLGLSSPCTAQALLEEILEAVPASKVVLLACDDDDHRLLEALRAGAAGYLARDSDHSSLVMALREVADGRPAISQRLLPALVGAVRAD